METVINGILSFASHANTTVILALAMVIIILLLLGGNKGVYDLLRKIFRKQKLNTYKMEAKNATLDTIAKQLDTVANNHLHELPQMNKNIEKILERVEKIETKQNSQFERIAKIEGFLKINIK